MRLDGMQNLSLLVANRIRIERDRRLHGGKGDQLQNVVRDHIAQRASLVVIPSALLDSQRFGHGDLHMVDVPPVPDGFEDSVRKAEDQDILHRLFAQIVVDAVNLIFRQDLSNIAVELARRIQIPSERLFDDDPPPVSVGLLRQVGCAQLLDDFPKQARRRSQVIEVIAPRAMFLLHLGQQWLEPLIRGGIAEVA